MKILAITDMPNMTPTIIRHIDVFFGAGWAAATCTEGACGGI
jgi:hypothetical protein